MARLQLSVYDGKGDQKTVYDLPRDASVPCPEWSSDQVFAGLRISVGSVEGSRSVLLQTPAGNTAAKLYILGDGTVRLSVNPKKFPWQPPAVAVPAPAVLKSAKKKKKKEKKQDVEAAVVPAESTKRAKDEAYNKKRREQRKQLKAAAAVAVTTTATAAAQPVVTRIPASRSSSSDDDDSMEPRA